MGNRTRAGCTRVTRLLTVCQGEDRDYDNKYAQQLQADAWMMRDHAFVCFWSFALVRAGVRARLISCMGCCWTRRSTGLACVLEEDQFYIGLQGFSPLPSKDYGSLIDNIKMQARSATICAQGCARWMHMQTSLLNFRAEFGTRSMLNHR